MLQQLEYPGSFQDVSVNDCFRPVSKYWDRLNRPEQLLTALPEAMRILADPAETGAVTIAMPEDVQAESYASPVYFFAKRVYTVERLLRAPPLSPARGGRASSAPPGARSIVAGGGVHYSDAVAALEKFATATGVPVHRDAGRQGGDDLDPLAHRSCLGAIGVTGTALRQCLLAVEADLVINIGTRLSDFTTASKSQFQHPARVASSRSTFTPPTRTSTGAVPAHLATRAIRPRPAHLVRWPAGAPPPRIEKTAPACGSAHRAAWDNQKPAPP